MLSVGHIAPDTDIHVTLRFAMLASAVDGQLHLRIPLTVGDVYGRSGLADADELTHAPSQLHGSLSITGEAAGLTLHGAELAGSVDRLAISLVAAIAHPDCPVLPCIRRAPLTLPGAITRLLLIS